MVTLRLDSHAPTVDSKIKRRNKTQDILFVCKKTLVGSEYFCVLIPVTFIFNADSEEILVKRPNDFLVSRIIRPGLPNSNRKDGDLQIKKSKGLLDGSP